jgi:uncharacterized protein YkwD
VVLTVEPCPEATAGPAVVCSATAITTTLAPEPRHIAAATPTAAPNVTTSAAPEATTVAGDAAATTSVAAAVPSAVPAPAGSAAATPTDDVVVPPEPAADNAGAALVPPPAPRVRTAKAHGDLIAQVVQLVNAERAAAGIAALTVDDRLAAAAAGHAADQASRNHLAHDGSDGSTVADRVGASGFRWRALGENVAAGYRDASSVVNGWMNSPGHRKNILNPAFTTVGVAVAGSADGTYYWTMDLGRPG